MTKFEGRYIVMSVCLCVCFRSGEATIDSMRFFMLLLGLVMAALSVASLYMSVF